MQKALGKSWLFFLLFSLLVAQSLQPSSASCVIKAMRLRLTCADWFHCLNWNWQMCQIIIFEPKIISALRLAWEREPDGDVISFVQVMGLNIVLDSESRVKVIKINVLKWKILLEEEKMSLQSWMCITYTLHISVKTFQRFVLCEWVFCDMLYFFLYSR